MIWNVAAKNNRHLYITPLFICGLTCLASGFYDMKLHNTAKKWNLSKLDTDTKTRDAEKNQIVLFGCVESWTKESQKRNIWEEIPPAVNTTGVDNRSPADL